MTSESLIGFGTIDEKARITFRRLLLAKQMFLHGMDHANRAGPLNKIIAIHNLHNAIEIVMRAIFLHYEIRAEKELNIGFENMLTEIDNFEGFKKKNVKLPYRQEMRNLNVTRNLVEHHAVEPASGAMDEYKVFTRRFLQRSYQLYFGQDFETISATDMIEDSNLRDLLSLSFSEIRAANLKKGLTLAEATFYWASRTVRDFLPPGADGLYEDSFPEQGKLVRYLNSVLRNVGDTSVYYSAILATGIDLVDYKRFRAATVVTRFHGHSSHTSDGIVRTTEIRAHWGDKEPKQDDAYWVHEFVVNAIVHWQIIGLSPQIPSDWLDYATMLRDWRDVTLS